MGEPIQSFKELRGRTRPYASAISRCYVKLLRERDEVRVLGNPQHHQLPTGPWSVVSWSVVRSPVVP